jgi:gamma-glutamylcyclotransferase (GGCT)/AIG2-like uncharacterized protein YtfP
MSSSSMPVEPGGPRLFAYGTLLPGELRWHFLEPFAVDTGIPDRVAGRLFDTGLGYPAARFGPDGVIHGRTFVLRPERADEALAVLDGVEGAVDGDYRRARLTTSAGLDAWGYECAGDLVLTPIESGSWLTHRHGHDLPPASGG